MLTIYVPSSFQTAVISALLALTSTTLVELRTAVQEVTGSNLSRTNTQGLKNNWGGCAAFVMTPANG